MARRDITPSASTMRQRYRTLALRIAILEDMLDEASEEYRAVRFKCLERGWISQNEDEAE